GHRDVLDVFDRVAVLNADHPGGDSPGTRSNSNSPGRSVAGNATLHREVVAWETSLAGAGEAAADMVPRSARSSLDRWVKLSSFHYCVAHGRTRACWSRSRPLLGSTRRTCSITASSVAMVEGERAIAHEKSRMVFGPCGR